MSAEQSKIFLAFRQPYQMPASPTFYWAMIILGTFIFIEILAAGWKLFPEFVDQFSPGRTASKTSEHNKGTALFGNLQPAFTLQTPIPPQSTSAVNVPKLTNDTGIPSDSTLGIIECKLIEEKPTGQTLRIAMKARPGSSIDVQNIKIHVYFYEKTNEGEVVLTDSPIRSEWLVPPVDWANGNPQLLDVLYSGPQISSNPNTFYGYVVGIYYNNELQDSRAVPVRLAQDFPPPLFLPPNPK